MHIISGEQRISYNTLRLWVAPHSLSNSLFIQRMIQSELEQQINGHFASRFYHLPVSVKEFNHPSIGPDVISGLPHFVLLCKGVAQGVL